MTEFTGLLQFNSAMALAYAGCPSTLMTRGPGPPLDNAKSQEHLRRDQNPLRGQYEIDGLAGRIDGPIQVSPRARDFDVRLIDPPGAIRATNLAANPLIQHRRVPLDPPPDRDMIHG